MRCDVSEVPNRPSAIHSLEMAVQAAWFEWNISSEKSDKARNEMRVLSPLKNKYYFFLHEFEHEKKKN